ncbi:MAG: D-alanine--D-alanine ligase [Alphaproteobacteria bacterium]|jgi:D-alanine-D-alanine ligase
MSKRVALLLGGRSSERDVSLMSGRAISKALKRLGHDVVEIDPQDDFIDQIKAAKPDVVYNALHGTYGEDGAIPGILEYFGIPYTHSGIMPSAIAMDKAMTKKLLQSHGVEFAEGFVISSVELIAMLKAGKEPMQRPYVIKATNEGSTIGVYIVHEQDDELVEKLKSSLWTHGEKVLIEQYIPGKELSAAVVGGKAIGVLELRPIQGFYDYTAKYTEGLTEHVYPAEIPQKAYDLALEYAEKAHNVIECRTVSRSDFRYNPANDSIYFLEINTHPGFTDLSIVPEIAGYNGISFDELVSRILEDAKCNNKS